ncbi:DUF1822 family protein [Acaryochloris marina]|uniref:DUF1822 domain-containing protein n=1 Tax=Acaryochloris marina (strain MBIC 11017) TaxID=329726 RepID=B0C8K7_ACAM1|nr:DUF1822 family protein [Acaryochloris marina]ABW31269.1 hypothetical protein AM1_6339 [Acaryochloris marina MBIC11017]BDM79947.1 hypothetical protein AM10699_28150 [Acaryochloris marina MBIC10699]
MSLYDLTPDHVWLELPEPLILSNETTGPLSPQIDDLMALNQICETVVLPYFREYFPNAKGLDLQQDLWQLGLNGIGIESDNFRFVCLPSRAWDLDGVQVPQEWVNSPNLAADYFVAVQVDLEEGRLRLWGVTTHKTVKKKGQFIPRNRTYRLEREQLTETLNLLWLQQKYFPETQVRDGVSALTAPHLDELTHAWDLLRETPLPFAARHISFNTWASILGNQQWRRHAITLSQPQPSVSQAIQLSQWLNHQFEQGWQAINELIAPQLVGAFMDTQIKRAKLIDLGVELGGCQVSLMMTISAMESGINLQASVYPTGERLTLPPDLHLKILTDSGDVFKEVISRSDDEFIRYRFDASTGDRFTIQVSLGTASVSEAFQV